MTLLDYPLHGPVGEPPQHWVTPFNDDGFRHRQNLRKISAQYDRDWRPTGGKAATPTGERHEKDLESA